MTRPRQLLAVLLAVLAIASAGPVSNAQTPLPPATREASSGDTLAGAVEQVQVSASVADTDIAGRLERIFAATGRYESTGVSVRDGVVSLRGTAASEEDRKWAGDLARNTEGVAAVLNRIEVTRPSVWDFQPAIAGMRDLARSVVRAIPFILLAIVILIVTVIVARLTTRLARNTLRNRTSSPLLRDVTARGIGFLVFLAGLFVVFKVAGLTTIALTVVGGTGVLGIILGIAFREISENLLASVFLSVQRPFRNGDLIEIEGMTGYVQRLMTRATVLMTLDGNHVQIPNATVYRSIIRNYTSNPNRREDFVVGIGYDDSVADAQQAAMKVILEHPAVLKDPEPWVLVEDLGRATVNLRVYFWIDGSQHSWLKVRSSLIRLVKRAFQEQGISMPDEARELIFPQGVPVILNDGGSTGHTKPAVQQRAPVEEADNVATQAEGDLRSDAAEISEQARTSRVPEEGADLLDPNGSSNT